MAGKASDSDRVGSEPILFLLCWLCCLLFQSTVPESILRPSRERISVHFGPTILQPRSPVEGGFQWGKSLLNS
jgi:hypothetical protein